MTGKGKTMIMIQANELRIGNWVKYDPVTTVLNGNQQLTKWLFGGLLELLEGESEEILIVHPIPLTLEILMACGFKDFSVEGFFYFKIGNDTFLMSGGDSVWVERSVNDEGHSVGLGGALNLHQLQNLYYALTGEELTIVL